MRRAGLSVDAYAAGMMVSYCALNAARMKSETEKLALLLGKDGRVTRAVVEEYVAKDTEYKIYELTQAASRGSYAVFTEIAFELLEKGLDENALLSSLASHFRTLYECASMRGTDAEVAAALNMKPYPVKRTAKSYRAWERSGSGNIIESCFRFHAEQRAENMQRTTHSCLQWQKFSSVRTSRG